MLETGEGKAQVSSTVCIQVLLSPYIKHYCEQQTTTCMYDDLMAYKDEVPYNLDGIGKYLASSELCKVRYRTDT